MDAQHYDRRLGQLLVGRGLLTGQQLDAALTRQAQLGAGQAAPPRLGAILVGWGLLTRVQVEEIVSVQDHGGSSVQQSLGGAQKVAGGFSPQPSSGGAPTVRGGFSPQPSSGGAPLPPSGDLTETIPPRPFEEQSSPGAPAKRVGPYEVVRELGRGGMGVVFEAFDPRMQRSVAIKKLLAEVGPGPLARFRREARLAGQLRHPGIAQVYEIVTEGKDAPYLVMELVPGRCLRDLCKEGLKGKRAAELVQGTALALAHAHAHGVLHRDLKPHNVVVTPEGRPVVLDFGLARQEQGERLTLTGQMLGTPAYMAPEQVDTAHQATAQADVYGLGAILYECLTGQPPFTGANQMNVITALLMDDPTLPGIVRPGVHRDLETICMACLEKKPEQRYGGAQALADDLGRFLDGDEIEALPVSRHARFLRYLGRRPGLSAVLLLAIVLPLGALVAWQRVGSLSETIEEQEEGLAAAGEQLEAQEEDLAAAKKREEERGRALERGLAALTRLRLALQFRYRRVSLDLDRERVFVERAREEVGRAMAELNEVARRAPEFADLSLLVGEARLNLYDMRAAMKIADRVLKVEPKNGKAWLLKARVFAARYAMDFVSTGVAARQSPYGEEAAHCIRRAEELGARVDPHDVALCALAMGRDERAEEVLRNLGARSSEHVELAWAMWKERVHSTEVLEHLDAALEICPRMLPALIAKAAICFRTHDLKQSIQAYSLAILVKPDLPGVHDLHVARGNAQIESGSLQAAIDDFDRALSLRPDYAPALAARGTARRAGGDVAGAIADYSAALLVAPENVQALFNRANALQLSRRYPEALADFGKVLELDPKSPGAYTGRGTVLQKTGDIPAAVRDYDQALALDRDDRVAWKNRAIAKRALGDARGSALDFEQVLRLDPQHRDANNMRAVVREALGRASRY